MAMEAERSKGLHNFSMPRLKWGNQRFLRCVKEEEQEQEQEDIVAVRKKLMIDLKVTADNLKLSILQQEGGNNNNNNLDDPNPSKPWNLRRTRRASCTNNKQAQPPNQDNDKNKKNEKRGSRSFCVSLSKDEIQQDFWTLLRTKPPRRPKKRPRILQKQLDVSHNTHTHTTIMINLYMYLLIHFNSHLSHIHNIAYKNCLGHMFISFTFFN